MFLVFMFNKYLWTTSIYLYPILLLFNFSIRLAIRNGITWSVSLRPSELNLNPSLLRSKTPEATKSSQESVQFTKSHRLHLDPTSDSLQSLCVSPSEVLWTMNNVTSTLFIGYHVAEVKHVTPESRCQYCRPNIGWWKFFDPPCAVTIQLDLLQPLVQFMLLSQESNHQSKSIRS